MKTCLSILFFCLQVSLSAQTTWHVRSDASGAATGLSWTNAFPDLHLALNLAQPGDEVWVAQGLYRTDTANNRERYFELLSGVRLLGGFNGTETSADQSDPAAYPTILSGNIGNPDDSLDNAYNILYMLYPDSTTLLDGFILEHAYADKIGGSNQQPGRSGAAVFVYAIQGSAAPVFQRCIFRYNTATTNGGGMYVNGVTGISNTPVLKKCRFLSNKTLMGNGSALYWTGGGTGDRGVEIEDCVFENNISAFHGGALFISRNRGENETINIKKCQFFNNSAVSWGGVLLYEVADSSFQHRVVIDSCLMDNNYGGGGAIVNFFSNGAVPYRLHFAFENSAVNHNTTNALFPSNDNSGLFYCAWFFPTTLGAQDTIIFRNNTFFQNTAHRFFNTPGFGGTLFFENNTMSHNNGFDGEFTRLIGFNANKTFIRNNLFYANNGFLNYTCNSAEFSGNILSGNLYVPASSIAPLLAINTPHNDSIGINNNLFINNICRPEVPTTPLNTGKLFLYNNIFFNNKHALTGQNTVPIWRDTTYAITNIIDIDNCNTIPNLLCFPSNLHQPNLMLRDTAAGDYRLLPCSNGINAGEEVGDDLLTDYLGNPRITGPAIDIGPYEDPLTGLSAEYLIGPSCANLSNGSLTFFTGNNGCMPYEVSWNNEGPFDGLTAAPLPPGPVSVTLTDGVGRTLVVNITVPLSASPELLSVVSHASSATTADGAVAVEPQAGSGPFQYLWSTGDTTGIIGGLLPGVYTLTLTDATGCQYSYVYEVSFNIGITEQHFEMSSVWPNPASTTAQVRWSGCEVLEVYSMQGQKLVNHTGANGNQFQVSQLPAGFYQVVFLKNGRMVHRSRLVVAH